MIDVYRWMTVAALCTFCVCSDAAEQAALEREQLLELVSGKTALCRKEKDQSLCANWFAGDGVLQQVMQDDDGRKQGRWFVDDQARLCILWDGKLKPLCFAVFAQPDGSYNLLKNDRHITTITGFEDGRTLRW